jgi:hypothetical protein
VTFLYIISSGYDEVNTLGLYPAAHWDLTGQVSVHLVRTRPTLQTTRILTLPGIVIAAHDESDEILNKRVFLVPTRGWEKDPLAPEAP